MIERKKIEERIIQIISFIDQKQTLQPLSGSLKLFSIEDLLKLKDFLENGNYDSIYRLVDKKIKEFLKISEEIKQLKIGERMKNLKEKEKKEKNGENLELKLLLI